MLRAKRIRIDWILYVVMALSLIGLLVWSTIGEIARTPAREAVADMGPYGLVTIQFQTNPYPALPTGTVELSFMLMDSRRRIIQPDSLSYEYGRQGEDEPASSGTAFPMEYGSGMLMAGARFSSVGTWWLRARVVKDGYQDEVRFLIDVRPAQ